MPTAFLVKGHSPKSRSHQGFQAYAGLRSPIHTLLGVAKSSKMIQNHPPENPSPLNILSNSSDKDWKFMNSFARRLFGFESAPACEKIIFLHIPNTGGISLVKCVLEPNFREDEIAAVTGFRSLIKGVRAARNSHPVLRSHQEYGVDWFVKGQTSYITLLRNPIDRAVSAYYNSLGSEWPGYKHELFTQASTHTIAEFYELPGRDNLQTRLVSGLHHRLHSRCNGFLLSLAKRHLERRFSVVGIMERFEESMKLIGLRHQLRVVDLPPQNPRNSNFVAGDDISQSLVDRVRRARAMKREDISSEMLARLEETHRFDLDLYSFAQGLFRESLVKYGLV